MRILSVSEKAGTASKRNVSAADLLNLSQIQCPCIQFSWLLHMLALQNCTYYLQLTNWIQHIFLILTHARTHTHTHTHTHPFNGPFSRTTRVGQYQKGKTNLDFTEARDSEWQWHQLGHMQVCNSLQTDNHTSTSPLSFFTGRMPFLPPNQQCQSTEGISEQQMQQHNNNNNDRLTAFDPEQPG